MPSWYSRNWIWGLILTLAVVAAYSPVGWAGYVWDDDAVVTANPVIVGPLGVKEIWSTAAADICPLTLTTFWLEHAAWGLAPLPYHLVNVLQHAASAVILWLVLRCLRVPGAWLGAALWALHPVQTESTAWIAEMKNTESGLFYLLSILFFVRTVGKNGDKSLKTTNWDYALTVMFAALAMASKSSTVILPIVLGLCAWWIEGRWRWHHLVKIGPLFLLSMATGLVSVWTQGQQIGIDAPWLRSWPERLATAGDAIWFYLGKLLWPHPLLAIYPHWQLEKGAPFSYLPLLAVLVVPVVLWLGRGAWSRSFLFAWAYFLVCLLPVLGLINNTYFRYSLVADHFQYLASMGPLALAGAGLTWLADRIIPSKQGLQLTLGAVVLLMLGTLTWQRACAYESEETLWTNELVWDPGCSTAYTNLGNACSLKGQTENALPFYQKAVETDPTDPIAHNDLGVTLVRTGQDDAAIAEFQKALEINPLYAEAANNLGDVLASKGHVDDAIAWYEKALQSNPRYATAEFDLGMLFATRGQTDRAIPHFQKAIEFRPNYANAYFYLGIAYFQKGRLDEAIIQYQKAVEIDPSSIEAHNNLGVAYFQKGWIEDAKAEFQTVLNSTRPTMRREATWSK